MHKTAAGDCCGFSLGEKEYEKMEPGCLRQSDSIFLLGFSFRRGPGRTFFRGTEHGGPERSGLSCAGGWHRG